VGKKAICICFLIILALLTLFGCGIVTNQSGNSTPGSEVEGGSVPNGSSQSAIPAESPPGRSTSPGFAAGENEAEPAAPAAPVQSAGAAPIAPAVPDSDAVEVNIVVVGSDGEVLFGPSSVKLKEKEGWGVTALGALEATGVSYEVSKRWPDFVETIAGQRNKGQAGWLYKVNEEVPLVAAGKKQLAAGDRVIWWYSRSINNPAPVWEQFVKSTEQ
jgi:hypothetical protein